MMTWARQGTSGTRSTHNVCQKRKKPERETIALQSTRAVSSAAPACGVLRMAAAISPTVGFGGLFDKPSFRSVSIASTPKPTGGTSEPSTANTSPLGTFLDRLFPSGDFLDRLAKGESRDGSKRSSYFKGRPSSSGLSKGTSSAAAGTSSSSAAAGNSPRAPSSTKASPRQRRDSAAERKQRIRERAEAQALLEQSSKSEEDRRAAERAASAAEERRQRIKDRGEGSSTPRPPLKPRAANELDTVAAKHEKDALRLEQLKQMRQQELAEAEKARTALAQRAEQTEAKKREQNDAAARKAAALKEKQDTRQRKNEEKLERARKVQADLLQKHQEKRAAKEAKEEGKRLNNWWCDVAFEGCTRPTEGSYEPAPHYCDAAGDYMVCEACFSDHLTDEQREELRLV